jgi:hypothetical protein
MNRPDRFIEMRAAIRRSRAAAVDTWNALHPIGTRVWFWPGTRKGPASQGTTRSHAIVDRGGQAVVFIDGFAGCIALENVQVRR